jgi:hypothetical protein
MLKVIFSLLTNPMTKSTNGRRPITRPVTSSSISSRPTPNTNHQSVARTSVSRPRPSSADPKHRYNRNSIGASVSSMPQQSTAMSTGGLSRQSISTEDQLVHFEKLVEDKVRQNVKQADSYHTLQVHSTAYILPRIRQKAF